MRDTKNLNNSLTHGSPYGIKLPESSTISAVGVKVTPCELTNSSEVFASVSLETVGDSWEYL